MPRVRERRSRVKDTYSQGAPPLDNPVQGTMSLENPAAARLRAAAFVPQQTRNGVGDDSGHGIDHIQSCGIENGIVE